jgi:hypothetical protein
MDHDDAQSRVSCIVQEHVVSLDHPTRNCTLQTEDRSMVGPYGNVGTEPIAVWQVLNVPPLALDLSLGESSKSIAGLDFSPGLWLWTFLMMVGDIAEVAGEAKKHERRTVSFEVGSDKVKLAAN